MIFGVLPEADPNIQKPYIQNPTKPYPKTKWTQWQGPPTIDDGSEGGQVCPILDVWAGGRGGDNPDVGFGVWGLGFRGRV